MTGDTIPLVSSTAPDLHGAGNSHLCSTSIVGLYDCSMTEQSARIPLYLALIASCLGTAALLLRTPARLGWMAVVALSSLPFIGYVLSRSTGLPGDMGDIGN